MNSKATFSLNRKYSTYENIFILHSFQSRRSITLEKIAKTMAEDGYIAYAEGIGQIRNDNRITDRESIEHFTGLVTTPKEGHELHLKRCEESGIPQCTCMVKVGQTMGTIML